MSKCYSFVIAYLNSVEQQSSNKNVKKWLFIREKPLCLTRDNGADAILICYALSDFAKVAIIF